MRRALVLGGGGQLGLTWSVCALRQLERDTDWDPREATHIVGTSAGSILATLLTAGQSTTTLVARQHAQASAPRAPSEPRRPAPRRLTPTAPLLALRPHRVGALGAAGGLLPRGTVDASHLSDLVDRLHPGGGWAPHPATWVVALDVGRAERFVMGAPGAPFVPLRDAVRASCAIPGYYPPVWAAGRELVDGGMWSATSADLLTGADVDEIVVVSPLTSRPQTWPRSAAELTERALRRTWNRTLDHEVAALTNAGHRVRRLEPDDATLAVMGPDMMDTRRRAALLAHLLPDQPAPAVHGGAREAT